MKRTVLILVMLAALFSAAEARAADWYVRPGGGGGTGTSWTNAWNGLSAISWSLVSCGDTIWVAGGTYSQVLSPAKNCTSGAPLAIRRARSDAQQCTGTAGWSSSYDSTVHHTASMRFNGNYNYITVSGRTTAAGGSNGWWLDRSAYTSGPGIEWPNGSNASYITIEYLDLQGPGAISYTGDGRGIDDTPFSSAAHHTFSHMKIWDWESGAYVAGANYPVFEYIDMFNIMAANWSSYHPNGIYIIGSSNGVVRYSRFHYGSNGCGEGVVFSDGGTWNNWQIYGNLFYDLVGGGLKAIQYQQASTQGVKIFNNTFVNNTVNLYLSSAYCDSASESRNNLVYGTGGSVNCGTSSNNLSSSTNPFVNLAARDLHIIATTGASYPRNAGTNLSASFTKDMDGTPFGGDGVWDVGAFEYSDAEPVVTHVVSPSAGLNGSISPNIPQTVYDGASTQFTVTAGAGYTATVGGTCGGTLAGTTYTTRAVTADCTVEAAFVPTVVTHVVSPSAGLNGSISPNIPQTVYDGASAQFTVTAGAGYTATVGGTCGGSLAGTTYTTGAVTADCTVEAAFVPTVVTHVVSPSAGPNGSISPAVAQTVNDGESAQFTVTPNEGYTATVGGTCGGTLSGTVFTSDAVTADCTVAATFTQLPGATRPSPPQDVSVE